MRATLALLLLCMLWPPKAGAWGYFGHRIIAELAEAELDPGTRQEVQALLMIAGHDSLTDIVTWPDEIREQPAWRWTSRMHFLNFPRGDCQFVAKQACPEDGCVVGGVQRFLGEFGDRTLSAARRLEALSFAVHFIADAHQPLHAGWSDDKGGNLAQFRWQDKGTNLHAIWDFDLLAHRDLELPEYVAILRRVPMPQPGSLRPEDWVVESCKVVAEPWFYPRKREVEQSYIEQMLPVAEARMRLAASRTAAALSQALRAHPGGAEP